MGYFEKLKAGTAHKRYNPEVEGFGSEFDWCRLFNMAMGFEEATRFRSEQQKKGKWRTEISIIGDMAGVNLNEGAMWNEIKSAFRKATMNCHPDRTKQHGKTSAVAEEEFKQVSAAYTILAHQYGEN